MLKWYHEELNKWNWNELVQRKGAEFRDLFRRNIAPEGSLRRQNLITVLERMTGRGLMDVQLFFHRGDVPRIDTEFHVVTMRYSPDVGDYISLGEPHVDRTS